jgi:hypothetical protein
VAVAATVAVAAVDMVVAVAAATAAAIGDRAKRPIQYFSARAPRFHKRALFVNSFSRSGAPLDAIEEWLIPPWIYCDSDVCAFASERHALCSIEDIAPAGSILQNANRREIHGVLPCSELA